ncbi:hypothetical protein HRN75_003200 [Salmonella enterica]|uniref:Uncharacterized protein n=1 Tax=Salmonella enterica TaxID=28901 RepID=A0A634F690_SALER|nr:hypothetical protein [Salmonella enterica]EDH4584976.1 hypothetical protein [Salmonella enterica]EFV0355477.1 hypothetical protein [Salmonella enterica]EHL3533204.1 hypothetical protein [Salmonella enterica]EHN3487030.1 hypothetical protein [Salmonella enterica]
MLRERTFWCSFTVTRQQSQMSLQAAARNVKGAGVAAGRGFTGKFPAQSSIDQISGADKKR